MVKENFGISFDKAKLADFLNQAKEERFGKVERSSFNYIRVKEVALPTQETFEEDFYFSVDSIR